MIAIIASNKRSNKLSNIPMYNSTPTTHELVHYDTTITAVNHLRTPFITIVSTDSINHINTSPTSSPVEEIVDELLADYYSTPRREINIDNYYNEDIDNLPDDITEDINLD